MGRHTVRAEGTFGSAFGGTMGCLLGIACALGAVAVVGILMCAGVIGGCGAVVKDINRMEQEREASERERAKKEPRATAPYQTSEFGFARAKVKSAKIQTVNYRGIGQDLVSTDKYLVITIELSMTDDKRRWDFYGWSDDKPLLTDANGNKYSQPKLGLGRTIVGTLMSEKITSDRSVSGIIAFDAPPPGIDELNLDLPAHGVDGNGYFRFKLPSRMWKE